MRAIRAALALALLLFAGAAVAQQQQFSSANVTPIPDDGYNGTLASMACDTLPVTYGLPVTNASVRVNLDHTWIGDLTIKLVSPSGTVVTLLNRPGSTAPDDGSDNPIGDNSNWAAGTVITFGKAAGPSAETMGNTLADAQNICVNDGICAHDPAPDTAAPGTLSRSFDGQTGTGNWRLCVGDSALLDTGNLRSWSLTLGGSYQQAATVSIPDDGYVGGFGGAGMGCTTQTVSSFSGTLDDVALELNMSHTWVGDLTIKLRGPDSTVATIMNRPGSNAADDGGGAVGNNANLVAATHIEYWQPATTEAEQMGAGLTTDQVVCVNNAICEYNPNRDTATPPDDLSTVFDGRPGNGNWTLCIGDSALGDVGQLTNWRLTLVPSTPPTSDLAITKTDGATTEVPGTPVSYTIVASNPAGFAVAGATVVDTFNASLTGCAWTCTTTGVGSSCPASGSGNINTPVTLGASGSATFVADCTISAAATGTVTNSVSLLPPVGVTDPNSANNSATDIDSLELDADLSITKTDGAVTEVPGTAVAYTIVARNGGPGSVTGATVADTFAAPLSACTWTCAASAGSSCPASGSGNINASVNLANGGTATFTATCSIAATAIGTVANTATITPPAGVTDATSSNNSATDTDALTPQGALAISKTDGAATEVPGTGVTYTIVAANAGPSAVAGASVADTFAAPLSACTWTCAASAGSSCPASGSGNIAASVTLAAGGNATFTATCAIAANATGTVANTATIAAPTGFTDTSAGDDSATDSDTLVPTSDLAITKTDGATTEVPGTPVTYTITATNAAGPSAASNATLADTFPASLTGCTWTCAASAGSSCPAGGSGNIAAPVSIAVGGNVAFSATCDIAPSATGTLANTATIAVGAGASDPVAGNDSATDSDALDVQADLTIAKTDGATSEIPGTPVTYTITAGNNGPGAVTGATVADTFSASLGGCAWTCTASAGSSCPAGGSGNIAASVGLAVGGTATFSATCDIAPGATGSLVNTATIAAPAGVTDGTPGNNSATDTDTLAPQADLSITKTDGATTEVPGTTVTYTIVARNNGASDVAGASVTDTFPASLGGCSWTCAASAGSSCVAGGAGDIGTSVDLRAGGAATFTATCSIAASATGSLVNTATIAAPAGVTDPSPANDSATDSDTLTPQADLAITKTDGATTAIPGTSVTYTIVARNNGASDVPGATVTDTFPGPLGGCAWTCAASAGSSCPAGGSGNIAATVDLRVAGTATFTATCNLANTATGTLVNTATIAAPAGVTDPVGGNDSATDSDAVTPQADLSITKSDGVTTVVPGTSLTYTIVAANAGLAPVSGAGVFDAFPAGLTGCAWTCASSGGATCPAPGSGAVMSVFVDLPVGSAATFSVSCAVDPSATGTLVNSATITPPIGTTDPATGNNSAFDSDTLTPEADLAIAKTDGATTATPGGTTTYTITASNAGTSSVTNATVADTFPASLTCTWTCAAGAGASCPASGSGNINANVSLLPGRTATFTATCAIAASATGTLSNTATIVAPAGATDPVPGNNSATDSDTLVPRADLSVTKTDGTTTAVPGGSVTYTITAANAGESDVTGATVADAFPAALTCAWTCTATAGSSCPASGSGDIAAAVNLAVGGAATFAASCSIAATASGTLANTATVAVPAGATDPNAANDSATDTDTLTPRADLSVTKTDGATSEVPGTPVTYTIVAGNAGPSAASGVLVGDAFPAALSACAWTCAASTGSSCPAGGSGALAASVDLAVGGTATFNATCNVAANATGSLSNTATVTPPPGTTDPVAGNDSATDVDTLAPQTDLAITKTDGATTENPGTPVTYTIVARNIGPSVATAATVADTFAGTLSGCAWTCAASAGSSCPAGGAGDIAASVDLAVGGTATFTATCTIAPSATGVLANTATIAAGAGASDPVPGNDGATDTDTLVVQADLSITKTDGATSAVPGAPVTYTIAVGNAGPGNVANASVTDAFPAALTGCAWTCAASAGSSCPAGGSGNIAASVDVLANGTVTFTATCNVVANATGTLANTATVAAPAGATDPNAANDSATDSDTLTPRANLAITKTDGVASAVPGTTVTYTIVASNTGPSAAPGSTVSDAWPAACGGPVAWTCAASGGATCAASGSGNLADTASLPVGGSATYTAACAIAATATGTLANTATVAPAASVTDPATGDNSATDSDTLAPTSDLSVTKTDGATSAVPGTPVAYTIVAANAGPSAAAGATLTDAFAASLGNCAWTCAATAGSSCPASGSGDIAATVALASGGSATFTATCTLAAAATGTLVNTATIAAPAGTTDPNAANDSATDTDTLAPSADLAVTTSDGVASVVAGGTLTWTTVARNNGPSAVAGATVADAWPAACNAPVAWTCAGSAGGTCTASGSGPLSDAANLPPNASVTYTATCVVAVATPSGTTIANTATVTPPAGVTDGTPANDAATDTTIVANPASVSGTKTVSANGGVFAPGNSIRYLVVLRNAGPGVQPDNPGAELSDPLPAGVVFGAASASSGVVTFSAGTVSWNGSIPAGGQVQIAIDATIAPGAFGQVVNQGLIRYDADGNGTNEATAVTDDPGVAGDGQPTGFVVALAVPALGLPGLALLAAFVLLLAMRRRRPA